MRIFAQKMFCYWYFCCGRQVQCNIIYNDLKFRCFSISLSSAPMMSSCVCLVSVFNYQWVFTVMSMLRRSWAESVTSSCDLWIIFVINIVIVIMSWLAPYLVSGHRPSPLWSGLILAQPLYTVTGPPPGPGPGLAQHKPVSLRRSFQSAQESSEQTDCQCQSVRKLRKLEPGQSFLGPICGRLAFKCERNDFTRWLISCEKCQGPGLWVRMSEECHDCHCDDQLTRPD